jgi:LmbE family N-acetylglucosaminyl deacetylase
MLRMKFELDSGHPLKVLCLGAHSDDLEIGCGGSILNILKSHADIELNWIVFSASGKRAKEAINSANLFLSNAKNAAVEIQKFKDGFFPYDGRKIKAYFEKLKNKIEPTLIFTHTRGDLHQDHRLISELTWNTFRNHLILEYEVIKYDGDLGAPNVFFHLSEEECQKKVEYLMKAFKSQKRRAWFTEDALMSIMRLRGLESNSPEKFAEGFYCRKMVATPKPSL